MSAFKGMWGRVSPTLIDPSRIERDYYHKVYTKTAIAPLYVSRCVALVVEITTIETAGFEPAPYVSHAQNNKFDRC
ncbi:Uncharacterised protein [Streptococcus dysgalactiae subsp. dysgalactiae]|nr:Uncharacterised protein [Streptococcus dysgalactiae subsp. dysgalactiae]